MPLTQSNLLTLSLSLIAFIVSCSPKPKPSQPREPAAPEMQQPARENPGPSADELRRQQMQQRAREVFKPIFFAYDESGLNDQGKSILSGIRDFLLEYPEAALTIEGHCDERGTNEYNLALGERRARNVFNYLVELGVTGSKVKTASYGEERPAREGHTEEEWKLNRRAEFAPDF
jgi:peptidoglycan-associated lipoprotein